MADFKTHVSVGTFTGFMLMVATFLLHWSTSIGSAVMVFFATAVGAFLPDLDSDSGLPVRIIFGVYSFVAAAVAFYVLYSAGVSIYLVVFIPILVYLGVRFGVAPLFAKYTEHRGIFHSIPACLLSFFITLVFADLTRLSLLDKFVVALAVGTGYLCHLVLDEVFATNFLFGKTKRSRKRKFSFRTFLRDSFSVKKSFGTALQFTSNSRFATLVAYVLLIGYAIYTYPLLKQIIQKL